DFVRRIQDYMHKAVHEAKRNLSWVNTNPEYVEALRNFVARILHRTPRHGAQFWGSLVEFTSLVAHFGAINSVAQTLLKITAPGLLRRGEYVPLDATGSKKIHLCAFARIHEAAGEVAVVAVTRRTYTLVNGALAAPLGEVWEDTGLQLPRSAAAHFGDAFTGKI